MANGLPSTLLLDKDLAPPDNENADERLSEGLQSEVVDVLRSGKDSLSLASRDIILPAEETQHHPDQRRQSLNGWRARDVPAELSCLMNAVRSGDGGFG